MLIERLSNCLTKESNFLVDAGARCKDLLGSVTSSNIFLLGVAVQFGALPVITLNPLNSNKVKQCQC